MKLDQIQKEHIKVQDEIKGVTNDYKNHKDGVKATLNDKDN